MSGEIILVIEDDVHIAGLVAQVLREAGYFPALVRDVAAARAWASEGRAPAAILSDLMVAGSAGPERLPSQLSTLFPQAPLALMTGVPRNRRASLRVAHDRIIEKPFELQTLLDAVGEMLAARTSEAGQAP
jgi:DNA-binding NtrC family response regulator